MSTTSPPSSLTTLLKKNVCMFINVFGIAPFNSWAKQLFGGDEEWSCAG